LIASIIYFVSGLFASIIVYASPTVFEWCASLPPTRGRFNLSANLSPLVRSIGCVGGVQDFNGIRFGVHPSTEPESSGGGMSEHSQSP